MPEHLGTGEWDRWRTDDREWKREAMAYLVDHSERLRALETAPNRAQSAADTAESAKKWTLAGNVIGVVINGILIALGIRAGG